MSVNGQKNADIAAIVEELKRRNEEYAAGNEHQGDVSADVRFRGVREGQSPMAVIMTCSDSRVAPEHLFNAGLGEIFVIRTAGNVIGPFELGSIEYAADHLGTSLVVVLGHTHCGAVAAALSGEAHGDIASIVEDIAAILPDDCEPRAAEILNVKHSMDRIRENSFVHEAEADGRLAVVGAVYDIETGKVAFL